MRKLNRYLIKDYLTIFAVAMLLITFAFSLGAIYRAVDIMAKGLPIGTIAKFFLYNIPYSLSYSIPISALFATLLLFGRLSADSELSAMKSGGLSMWQIASPVILISIILSGFCLYNNCVVYPSTSDSNLKLIRSIGVEDPIKLLEEGRFIREFPGYMIYVGKKNKNRVRDLVVYEVDKKTGEVTGSIRADSGIMTADKEKNELLIDLFDVRIEILDPEYPNDATKTRYANVQNYPKRLSFDKTGDEKFRFKKRKTMTVSELIYRIRNPEAQFFGMPEEFIQIQLSGNRVELHKRICLSIAPFMFTLLAIPLGMKSHRKESSFGMIMSLAVMFIYYIFMILCKVLSNSPHLYPWLIPWIPIVLGQLAAVVLIRRSN